MGVCHRTAGCRRRGHPIIAGWPLPSALSCRSTYAGQVLGTAVCAVRGLNHCLLGRDLLIQLRLYIRVERGRQRPSSVRNVDRFGGSPASDLACNAANSSPRVTSAAFAFTRAVTRQNDSGTDAIASNVEGSTAVRERTRSTSPSPGPTPPRVRVKRPRVQTVVHAPRSLATIVLSGARVGGIVPDVVRCPRPVVHQKENLLTRSEP